ncbi:P-loop ATPase, Sll1717 family [Chryseobacterium sp. NKUCC03_KSP]|uniref:P-loop ATPase, Sll1717 family n=1 Tax=Chryseobacterium sp. NKUCC03_KSP TaxID=2842125 RepID=UPI001C5A6B3B|nr:hypothetical protein [Chryseobacterium sp. NKUCC03_KSP]MBW3524116.1 hypothetical protein [Chryseobacterium sp. NKUCC03_KSP]
MDNKLIFTEENINKLFGSEAAEDETFERLQSYYLKSKTHTKVTADLPLRILVGHKGIGKSALFKMAIAEDESSNRIPILIKPDDIAELAYDSQDFNQIIKDWKKGLNIIIAKKVLNSFGETNNDVSNKIKNFGGKLLSFISESADNFLKSYVNLDPTKKSLVEEFIKNKKVIVYLDDLDRGWQSKKEDITRISALLNACRDLSNDNFGLQFRISLRSDVYYLVRTSDESTDKIESSVVWHSWTNHEILLLLIKRIENFFGREFDVEKLKNQPQNALSDYLDTIFEKRFTDQGKWSNAPTYTILMSLIRKRPRDLVKLCTLAARNAYEKNSNLIRTDHLKAIFEEYSQGRIQDTVNEFKSELPQIDKLLLNMKPSRKELKTNLGYIYDTNSLKRKIADIRQQGTFRFQNGKIATDTELMQFLYKINFITARRVLESGHIDRKFFEENRSLSSQLVNFGYDWEIHPAFRWALQPEEAFDMYKRIDLSAIEFF